VLPKEKCKIKMILFPLIKEKSMLLQLFLSFFYDGCVDLIVWGWPICLEGRDWSLILKS
jgi:hypothetical protein